jgi:bacterioferritin-associated ferredoxin
MVIPAQQQVAVSLALPEVYDHLCSKCKAEIRQLIKEKVSDQMVDQIIGLPPAKK